MHAQQISRPGAAGLWAISLARRSCRVSTPTVFPSRPQKTIARAEKFERDERPPRENHSSAAKELSKEQSKAGAQEVDKDPIGGSGIEPPPADGEGQGYSMKDIAEHTAAGGGGSVGTSDEETSSGTSSDEAGVQDVE